MAASGGVILGRQFYELIPEEGKHLADSHDTEGAVRGSILMMRPTSPVVLVSLYRSILTRSRIMTQLMTMILMAVWMVAHLQ